MNIWSSIVHLGDAFFCRAGVHSEPSLDLLLSEALRRDVKGRQFWAINSVYQNPGTLGTLSKQAYPVIRGSNESYLAVVTPGFSDLVNDVPIDLQERYLRQVSQQLAIFKKRLVGVKLGCPSHFPEGVCKDIEQINDITIVITHNDYCFINNIFGKLTLMGQVATKYM